MPKLKFLDSQSCAIQEIDGLAEFNGSPRDAMISFCQAHIGRPVVWKVRDPSGNDKGANGALFSFYYFSASVYRGETSNYGSQFAAFIKENGLGDMITTPALINRAYHTDHSNQIWIWMPDVKALKKWWDGNKPTRSNRE